MNDVVKRLKALTLLPLITFFFSLFLPLTDKHFRAVSEHKNNPKTPHKNPKKRSKKANPQLYERMEVTLEELKSHNWVVIVD